jgi:phenylacetate-CoA ligase
MRIKGWMGRADQATKVKGMFIRPEQIAQLLKAEPAIVRAKAVVSRQGEADHLELLCETEANDAAPLASAAQAALKLSAEIKLVPVGSLPNDGLVIEDTRDYS